MALDRKAAKRAISSKSESDPELIEAQRQASEAKLALMKEENNHQLKVAAQDMGAIGRFLGGSSHAPHHIVAIILCACLLLIAGVLFAGYKMGDVTKWTAVIDGIWGFAGLALGYLMGQGGSKKE